MWDETRPPPGPHASILNDLAATEAAAGDEAAARAAYRRAGEVAEEIGNPVQAQRSREGLASLSGAPVHPTGDDVP